MCAIACAWDTRGRTAGQKAKEKALDEVKEKAAVKEKEKVLEMASIDRYPGPGGRTQHQSETPGSCKSSASQTEA